MSHLTYNDGSDPGLWFSQLAPLHSEDGPDHRFHVLSRYDDVLTALLDPGTWSNRDGIGLMYQSSGVLGGADDPDHARQRRTLNPVFLPRALDRVESRIGDIADGLIKGFIDAGEADFVEVFAFPFPALVLAELIGVAAADLDDFKSWSLAIVSALATGSHEGFDVAAGKLRDYVQAQVDERDGPGDDLLSHLAQSRRAGEVTTEEVRRIGQQLLVAGHETTTSMLGTMLHRLAARPDVLQALRQDPTRIPDALEESLRLDTPVQGLFRTNTCPVSLHGTELPERSKVQLLFAAANRDPGHWERPGDYDLDRDPRVVRSHLAFGRGKHACIGASLARLEGRIALERLVPALFDLQLAGAPVPTRDFMVRGYTSLPLRWSVR